MRGLLARDTVTLTVVRKARETVEDVRPALRRVEVVTTDGLAGLDLELVTRPRMIRPGEALAALREVAGGDLQLDDDRVLRTHHWIERDGARLEPLDADARSNAPHGEADPSAAPLGAATRTLEPCA